MPNPTRISENWKKGQIPHSGSPLSAPSSWRHSVATVAMAAPPVASTAAPVAPWPRKEDKEAPTTTCSSSPSFFPVAETLAARAMSVT